MWKSTDKNPEGATDENFTFLSRGAAFQGVVKFEGTVRIDGTLDGEVSAPGSMIVGEQGIIKGMVSVGSISVNGKVYASVIASKKIEIGPSGMVVGAIQTPCLTIESGGIYQGECDMGASEQDGQAASLSEMPAAKGLMAKAFGVVQMLPARSES